MKYSEIHEYSLNIYKFINEKWLLWWNRAKIISFMKNAHLPENVHEKTHFHEKSAPKKIRKGSEASEGELTI